MAEELWLPEASRNGHNVGLLERRLKETTKLLTAERDTNVLLSERFRETITELELALEDRGWVRMRGQAQLEFSREGIDRIIENSRLMYIKNPLIKRAINVQSYYVFGQGVQVSARDEKVNEVVQRFIDDRKNRDELFAHRARTQAEQALQHDGNLFFALFTDPKDGRVIVRTIPVDQMRSIVKDPEDAGDRWYYRREWDAQPFDIASGRIGAAQRRVAYYPDWRIYFTGPPDENGAFSGKHPNKIGDVEVKLTPVMHVAVGGLRDWDFGIPDIYAALDWAYAYKQFLENWHSIVQSLSRFAWKATAPTAKVEAMTKKLSSTRTPDTGETNPPPVTGATFVADADTNITPIPKTGATVAAEDGRMLRLMVASGVDLPDTILSGDPDMGNLATAKTLDRPTELAMRDRQILWQDVFRDLCEFAIQADMRAQRGGIPTASNSTLRPFEVEADPNVDTTIEVKFPPVLEQDRLEAIKAVVAAATLEGNSPASTIPPEVLTRMLLVILEVEDVDALVEEMFPADAEADGGRVVTQERALFLRTIAEFREALRHLERRDTIVLHESPTDDAQQTGVMVGWFLPDDVARELAVPGGEPADQLHLTLAFLGNIDEVGTDNVTKLTSVVSAFAGGQPAWRGVVSGLGRFQGADPEPVWASVDVPGLTELRTRLVSELRAAGLEPKTDHGFAPHITLAWVARGAPSPVSSVPQTQLQIDGLTVAVAGDRFTYPLVASVDASVPG